MMLWKNIKEDKSPNWPYRILITGGSGSGKTNVLFNSINHKGSKDSSEAKYKFLTNKRESADLKHLNNSKTFTECSNDVVDIFKTLRIQSK